MNNNSEQNDRLYTDCSLKDLLENFYSDEYSQAEFGLQVEKVVLSLMEQSNSNHPSMFQNKNSRFSIFAVRKTILRVVLIASILLVGLIIFVSPLHSLAQDSLDKLLASFGYTRQSSTTTVSPTISASVSSVTPSSSALPSPTAKCDRIINTDNGGTMCMHDTPTKNYTQQEVSAEVGFPVKLPSYLPRNYISTNFLTIFPADEKLVRWGASYPIKYNGEVSKPAPQCIYNFISLTQYSAAIQPKNPVPLDKAKASEVRVSDVTGLWIENLTSTSCDGLGSDGKMKTIIIARNSLSWEKNGVKYELEAAGPASDITLDEMLKIAQSLK